MRHQKRFFLFACLCWLGSLTAFAQTVPLKLQARILQLEDERNLNGDELPKLLKHISPIVRHRAIIAMGRIGDERGVAPLLDYLEKYKDETGQPLVVFALGEIESAQAVPKLLRLAEQQPRLDTLNARAAEALGKIASVPANAQSLGAATLERISQTIINLLPAPMEKLEPWQRNATGWCITALLRLRSPLAVAPLTQLLQSPEAPIRAQAANALSRLRLPIAEAVPALIAALSDNSDTDFRANAARALGVSQDARAIEPLINSLNDKSTEVEFVAIRSLAQLNDPRAIEPLIQLFEPRRASTINVMLEAAAALTTLKAKQARNALRGAQVKLGQWSHAEIEIALGSIDDAYSYSAEFIETAPRDWRGIVNLAKGLAASPDQNKAAARIRAAQWLVYTERHLKLTKAIPELLRTVAKLQVDGLEEMFRQRLTNSDLHIRATAARLLPIKESELNQTALIAALTRSANDSENDAKLAILSALAKYKTPPAIAAIKTALKVRDQLVRRHTVNLLKQLDAGDFSTAIGTVQTGRTPAFYQQVVAASQQKLFATITTAKGTIKLELFAQDAPLTVHNFVTLARKGYFNGLTFHRVVPNFVIQGGDPRGDGDGGPGYAIRCEINMRAYGRGALGMALSGKDTGGSQWFITHAPQPHLDGGYTVFGQVVAGMNVVDRIARDDVMQRVVITHQ